MHQQIPHESAILHVTGEALYVDDLPSSPTLLTGRVVYSPHAHARIVSYRPDEGDERSGGRGRAVRKGHSGPQSDGTGREG